MNSFNLPAALRGLGLAAAVLSPLVAGSAFADGYDGLGPSANPAWSQVQNRAQNQAQVRTMLASPANGLNTPAQHFLARSGATGGDGQHG